MTAAVAKASARIVIRDLPEDELLTQEEMDLLFGAGKIRLGVESLEQRDLMAAQLTASLTGSMLRIEGTDKGDEIRILQTNGQISVEGISIQSGDTSRLSINVNEIDRIFVDGLEGDDKIWAGDGSLFLTPSIEVSDLAGGGADTLHSGGSTAELGDATHITKAVQFGGDTYTIKDGDLYRNGSKLSVGGYSLAAASLSVGDQGLAIGGFANMGFLGVVQFQGTISTNGDFSLQTDVLKPTTLFGGAVKLSAATITISSAGAKLNAHADILSFGYADVEGLLVPGQDYKLTGKGGVKLGSLSYEAIDFTLGNADLDFKIPVPAIGDVAMRGSYKPDGSFYIQGTYPGEVPVGPVVLKNITVGLGNDRFALGADASVANMDFAVDARIDGVIYFDGRYTLTGDARALNVGTFSFGTAKVVVSNDPAVTLLSDRTIQMTVDGQVGIPGVSFGPKSNLHGVLNGNGYYLLQGEDSFEIAGLKLQKTKFKLEKGVGLTFEGDWNYGIFNAHLSGSIAASGKATFVGDADVAKVGGLELGSVHLEGWADHGVFSFVSTQKTITVSGFSLSESTVSISNVENNLVVVTKVTSKIELPALSKLDLTSTITTSGDYAFAGNGSIGLANLSLANGRFGLSKATGFTFDATLSYGPFSGAIKGNIDRLGHARFEGDGKAKAGGFTFEKLRVVADLDPAQNKFAIDFTESKNVLVATVNFRAHVEKSGQNWPSFTLIGDAAIGGVLASALSGNASFVANASGVTFSGSLSIPNMPGKFAVRGTVYADGSVEIDGIPGKFLNFPAQQLAKLWKGIGAAANDIAKGLNAIGTSAADIAKHLKEQAGATIQQVAGALGTITRDVGAIGTSLKNAFNASLDSVTDSLYRSISWTTYQDVARGLSSLTSDVKSIASSMRIQLNASLDTITDALYRGISWTTYQDVAKGLSAVTSDVKAIASSMQSKLSASVDTITDALYRGISWTTYQDVAKGLSAITSDVKAIASSLRNKLSASYDTITDALYRGISWTNYQDVAKGLSAVTSDVKAIASSMQSKLSASLNTIADALYRGLSWTNCRDVAKGLSAVSSDVKAIGSTLSGQLGASYNTIADALYNGISWTNYQDVAKGLSAVTSDVKSIASAMRNQLGASYNTIADAIYRGISWTTYRDVAKGLSAVTSDVGAIASAMRNQLGASLSTVADALYRGISWTSYQDVANGLKSVTNDAKQIANALQTGAGAAASVISSTLRNIGSGLSNLQSALGAIGGGGGSVVNTIASWF